MIRRIQEREAPAYDDAPVSQLAGWPCQIRLVPVNAPYFKGADLLIAAGWKQRLIRHCRIAGNPFPWRWLFCLFTEIYYSCNSNGMFVKRPLVVDGDIVLTGYKEAEWTEKL